MPFVEDLAPFFDVDEFATSAALLGIEEVRGIFDQTYTDPYGVASTEPRFTCPAESVPNVTQGDELVIMDRDGAHTTYLIRTVEPYANGLLQLKLARR